jgi:hypothetical protein
VIRCYGLGHGYTITLQHTGLMLECQWAPDVPRGKTAKKLLPAYRQARDKFLSELANGQGFAVIEI